MATLKSWTRDRLDELAIAAGYTFDPMRAMFAVWWIECFLRLWEGRFAGDRFHLVSYAPDEPDWWNRDGKAPPPRRRHRNEFGFVESFDWFIVHKPKAASYPKSDAGREQFKWDQQTYKESVAWCDARCKWHNARQSKNKHLDWQFEFVARLFGWITSTIVAAYGFRCRRFVEADAWVAKKNKKSPTQAAVSLYLACADGEPANHVYPAAADGKQIRRIVGKHVLKMVKASPILALNCRTNQTEKSVEYLPTAGTIEPLSNNNLDTQKSSEGLNGDMSIDEAHVVDGAFIDRVDRAGISRPEPLFMSFSTAGDEPDSWGRRWWQSGEENLDSGDNVRRLHLSYHAPQRAKVFDVLKDLEAMARAANPALGHTVQLEELTADVQRSKRSRIKSASLLRYRFNVWQRGSVLFIGATEWDKCAAPKKLTFDVFKKRGGGAGFDMSLVDDLTSLVLAITPDDELIKSFKLPKRKRKGDDEIDLPLRHALIWPITWISSDKLEQLGEAKPEMIQWAERGELRVIDGRVVSEEILIPEIISILKAVGTRYLSADMTHADNVCNQITKRTRVEIVDFPQQFKKYSKPTDWFERLALTNCLRHPANPCFDWQLANTLIREVGKMRKPVKPKERRDAKIDAVQAGIMSLDALARADEVNSYKFYGATAV